MDRCRGPRAVLSIPLAWALLVFALLGPIGLRPDGSPATRSSAVTAAPTAAIGDPAPAIGDPPPTPVGGAPHDRPTDPGSRSGETDGSPAVLGLPPKIHLLVNRGIGATAPSTPVQAPGVPAAAGRTDAGIRIATTRAGHLPAGEPPGNSRWGRAPPHASV